MSSKAKLYPVDFEAPGGPEARESHVCVRGVLRDGLKQCQRGTGRASPQNLPLLNGT